MRAMRRSSHSVGTRALSVCLAAQLAAVPLLLSGAACAQDDASASADYKSLREQAIHYYRQSKGKLWPRSVALLKQAAATKDGGKDWKTLYWLAKITNEQNILEDAFPAAQKSAKLAKSDDHKKKSQAIVTFLGKSFAGVTFSQDERQKKTLQEGYIILDVDKPLINKQKKAVFSAIKDRFGQTKVKLPKTLYLPFGEYRANGAPFKIEKGQEAKAVLFLFAEPGGDEGFPWLWLAAGITGAAALVAGVGALIFIRDEHQDFVVDSVVVQQ